MARTFYAMLCPYGIRTASISDSLVRFSSEAERELWVSLEPRKREAITREQAKHYFPQAFKRGAAWEASSFEGVVVYAHGPTGGIYKTC